MVEDKEIKATVSPFAIRPGEIKVFDGKDGYVSMNQIIHKINVGHINDLHFKILELVNKFEFMTSRQIFQMLEWEHIDIESQDKLNNKLEQLTKTKILTRYYFDCKDGKGVLRLRDRYVNLGVKNVSCKLYEGGRHEMLNEINKEEVMKDIISWLNERQNNIQTIKNC